MIAPALHTTHLPIILKQPLNQPWTIKRRLGAAVHAPYFADERYRAALSNFQQVTPENAGKFDFVQAYGWGCMDEIEAYARSHAMSTHYHCLRWWFGAQPPDYEAWIVEAMTRYQEIDDWDVVNEGWDATGLPTIPGICESYTLARDTRPAARLWYNGLLFGRAEQMQVMGLVCAGLCDAVGIQMHHSLDTDINIYIPFVSWLRDYHIPWRISELDVLIPDVSEASLAAQAQAYMKAVQMCTEYGGESVTTWGVADCLSWKAWGYPLPFDENYQPKPAWGELESLNAGMLER